MFTLPRLANMLALPVSSTHDWFRIAPCPQVQALLCLLERLPQREWQRIIRGFLREYPTLQHPRISHDPVGIGALELVLAEQTGLTTIQGATEDDRNFLFAALGHAFVGVDRQRTSPVGLDSHEPRKLVPVIGVAYLRRSLTIQRKRQILLEQWKEIVNSDASLVLLNGVLEMVPELQSSILSLAKEKHVIIAEAHPPAVWLKGKSGPVRTITLSKVDKRPSLLSATVATI